LRALLAAVVLALLGFASWLLTGGCGCSIAPEPDDVVRTVRRTPLDHRFVAPDARGVLRATDRLNIALKDTTASLEGLADDLRKAFPEDGCFIGHRDDETGRLQFHFPGGDCDAMKRRIKEALPDRELLIWAESIFGWAGPEPAPAPIAGALPWHLHALNAPNAWSVTRGDPSMVIAVLDDGFDTAHVALRGRYVHPYNVRTGAHAVSAGPDNWHGTHVAGLVAGDRTGIAPACRIMPVQLTLPQEQPTVTDVIDGILYAMRNGAQVINMSLARVISPDALPTDLTIDGVSAYSDEELFWAELFAMLDARDITLVMAAGNQGIPVGLDPMQRHPHTIKVAAVDSLGRLAAFSNYGPSTIPAPGVQVLSCVAGGGWTRADGTSMAAPLVAGMVGLIRHVRPSITNEELVPLLAQRAHSPGTNGTLPDPAHILRSLEPVTR
jgi:subtilisin family serine protease